MAVETRTTTIVQKERIMRNKTTNKENFENYFDETFKLQANNANKKLSEADTSFLVAVENGDTQAIIKGFAANGVADSALERYEGICFYGWQPQQVSQEQYDAMSDLEKRNFLVLKYKPLCLKKAYHYAYDGAEFEDLFMEACVALIEIIDECGVDSPHLSRKIWSRLGDRIRWAGQRERQTQQKQLLFGEAEEDVEVATEESILTCEDELTEKQLADDMKTLLCDRELEMAQMLFEEQPSQAELAREFGISQQTASRRIAQIRQKLEPLKEKYTRQVD